MNELRVRPKIAAHLIIVLLTLLLMAIAFWALFLREDPDPGEGLYIAATIIGVIGAVVLFFAIRIIIYRPDVIRINDQGFEYNPGGISSGLIEWNNVQEIKRVQVRTQQGNLNGPVWETTLAVKLKDPELYRKHFNIILQQLMKWNDDLYDADLFIRISSLGKDAKAAEEMMMMKAGTN